MNSGHRVSNCHARGRCAKCKGKHHTRIHGIRIRPSISNVPFQRNTPTQQRPPFRTYTHAAIVTNDASAATYFTETAPTTDSSPNLITTNCAPLFNGTLNDLSNDLQHHLTIADDKSPHNDASKANGINNEPLGHMSNSPRATNHTILLKTAKVAAVANNTKTHANIFFDEGSQRGYVRKSFANQLGLAPESYEPLSVSGFGGTVMTQNYGVSTIGLETTSGIEFVKVLVSDEIVKPLSQTGCSGLRTDPVSKS